MKKKSKNKNKINSNNKINKKNISKIILIILLIICGSLLILLFIKDHNSKNNNSNKKNKTKKVEEKIEIDNISVIRYENIKDSCDNNYNCITLNDFEKEIDYLEDEDYTFISIDEFNNWRQNKKKLYKNSILLITNDKDIINNKDYKDTINYINNDNGLTLLNDNNKSNINDNYNSVHNYNIRSNTKYEDFIKMVNGEYVKEELIIDNPSTSIPVLNYHFFYNPGSPACCEQICENTDTFKSHLNYLRDNNYTVLTMDQYVKWIYGEIEVPERSVLITIDDGAAGTGKHNGNLLIPILEEYKMHATLFLITGWWDINNYRSPYLEIQSHTNDMHNNGSCGNVQLICASKEELSQDLDQSFGVIGNNRTFCYPFYRYDEKAIEVIKEKGVKVAFAGGSRSSTRNSNKYAVPRYEIFDTTSFEKFVNIVK